MHEHIFTDNSLFAECHASTLVQMDDGTILAAWFGGTREKDSDVAIWGARRENEQWSDVSLLAKVRESAHWNPVLFIAPDKRIHLFFKVGDAISIWETWTITSDDGGRTWSDPRELVPGDKGGRGPVKNKPILLSDGAWLAPASVEREKRWDAFVDRSEDGGISWSAGDYVPIDRESFEGSGVIQPTLWESEPGRVHMLMRSTCGWVCRSDSEDLGRTWSPVRKTSIPNNNSGIDLAKLSDGRLALAYNPISGNWAPRTPLAVAISEDNGETWPYRLDIETEPGEYSYPAIIPVQNGIAITYSWRKQRIAFWSGSLAAVGQSS